MVVYAVHLLYFFFLLTLHALLFPSKNIFKVCYSESSDSEDENKISRKTRITAGLQLINLHPNAKSVKENLSGLTAKFSD